MTVHYALHSIEGKRIELLGPFPSAQEVNAALIARFKRADYGTASTFVIRNKAIRK